MGILARVFERRASASGSFHVSQEPPGWVEKLSGWTTATSRQVTPDNALEVTAVFAAVRILAESVASLPLPLYRRVQLNGRQGKERARAHPLYRILHDAPNSEMSSFTFRETLMGHVTTWGNAYAEIEVNNAGDVAALWPLRVDKMERIAREAGRLKYYYRLPDSIGSTLIKLDADRIFHVKGLSSNGLQGYSPIQLARQAVGLALSTEEFGGRFFANGARPGVVLEHPGELSKEAHERLKSSWEERHQGLEHAHRVAILEEGMTVKEVGLPPESAQFLQTRKFQLNEIARMFRIPPHMLADLDRATFGNIEHQSIEFVMHTLRPWLVRWEQEIWRTLLTPTERQSLFAEHLVDALLRGDIAARYQAYATGRQNGWLSANDIREFENQNPIAGGDVYLVPLNMIPAGSAGEGLRSAERPRDVTAPAVDLEARSRRSALHRHRLEQANRSVYADVLARVLRRERNDVGNAASKMLAKRSHAEFDLWLEGFYEEHGRFVYDQVAPVATSYGELVSAAVGDEINEQPLSEDGLTPEVQDWIHSYLAAHAARHGATSRMLIRETIDKAIASGEDPAQAVVLLLEGWPDQRAVLEAQNESVRFGNALAKFLYVGAGFVKVRWRAFGESCPYCTQLDGQVVGVQEFFLPAGVDFQPEGADYPLNPGHNIGHAPAHDGCDCMVTAAF